jgi:hypothetical protein
VEGRWEVSSKHVQSTNNFSSCPFQGKSNLVFPQPERSDSSTPWPYRTSRYCQSGDKLFPWTRELRTQNFRYLTAFRIAGLKNVLI